ncbi:MAG: methionine--tRNA ligase [bacterium]
MSKSFYLTTTLPYVNAKPHSGHALEFVRADAVVRYKRAQGYDVFFNTGTDEHGQKLYDAAKKEGVEIQKYVDNGSENFKNLLDKLGVNKDYHFSRTTNSDHVKGAQELWNIVQKNGFIYKARYQTKYCVGCELEKTDSELVNGKCPDHPNLEIQIIDEENYFFKFSSFEKQLQDLYEKNPTFVIPESRMKEIKSLVSRGLKDFSISRLKSKMAWGVPVPGDDEHVMYVWFDALTNYITALGWPNDTEKFKKYWTEGNPTQYCGQDNLKQQSAIWQAMLMAAGLPNSHQIIVNGFVMGEGGIKMSKTLGNVVDPLLLIEKYGTDAVRYFVLRHIHPGEGSPMSEKLFAEAYESHLVNGLGNLTSRLLTMSEKYLEKPVDISEVKISNEWNQYMDTYRMDLACEMIWKEVGLLDQEISETEPFKLIKTDAEKAKKFLTNYVARLYNIALMLEPLLPETSKKIIECIVSNKKPTTSLFPKIV